MFEGKVYDEEYVATIEDETGEEYQINVIAELEFEGRTFCAFYENDVLSGETGILETVLNSEGFTEFQTVEDEELYAALEKAFSDLFFESQDGESFS